MSTYQVGSLCEDCLQEGLEKCLKLFYINLEEQIIKCESSRCMFPYMHRTVAHFPEPKTSQCTISLDEFIEQSFKQIDSHTPSEPKSPKLTAKVEPNMPDMYDFSSIFMNHPIKTEVKETPMIIQTIKQETTAQPVVQSKSKLNLEIKQNTQVQKSTPKKSRISKCFSEVKSSARAVNAKRAKARSEKVEPVFVVEPQSGKVMRPLDLIKRYIMNK